MKDIEFGKEIQEIIDESNRQPGRVNALLDLKLSDCSRDEKFIEYFFDVKDWCLNPYNGVHGGIICSVLDTAMGKGVVAITQKFASTADMSVSFLAPMRASRYLIRCDYTQIGRRMVRVISKAIDANTKVVCATCMASFVLTEARAKGLQD
jgi:uncharacterized protein (TIGR00369 family)